MDDVFKSDFHYQEHTGELTHVLTQPTEDLILDRNRELRKNKNVIRDLGQGQEGGTWGRQVATIPMNVFEAALRDGFEFNSKNATHAAQEMNRFLQTPMGKSCLVQGD